MDVRGMVLVEVKKDSRPYYFYMPVGSPYADAVDAALLVAEDIKTLHDQAVKKMKEEEAAAQEKKEDSPQEEPKKKNKKNK